MCLVHKNKIIMKNITKKISVLLVIISVISCRAQQILPLNTFLDDIPANAHLKDLNNQLEPFIGIYKANFNNRETTLYITKIEDHLEKSTGKSYFSDILDIKFIVKDSYGNVLQDTKNINDTKNELQSIGIHPNGNAEFFYSGTNCDVGWGGVTLNKVNANQISWHYKPNGSDLTEKLCPGNPDIKVYLPYTKGLIFNKQ